jgi:WD40 repeat protein
VVAARLTILYGPSGVGKSSLIAAAVARSLRALPEQPVVVVYSSWSDDPAAALALAVAAEAGTEPAPTLAATVESACRRRGDVYLLLDQAEEYFLYHPDGGTLEPALAEVLRGASRANVLLSLREDALAKLDRFKASIPGILDNYLRLDRLSPEAARAAVVGPLARFAELGGERVEIELALVEAVLDQVAAGQIRGGLGGAGQVEGAGRDVRIEAPYLQLVLERLWEVEREEGSLTLRATTLERLGGAARIVADHLERALAALPAGRREIASRLFRQLVTPSGTKIAYAAADLVGYADAPAGEVHAVLDALAERRILRPGDDGTYEIYHDVLAEPVLDWCSRHRQAQALATAHRRSRRLALVAVLATVGLVLMALVTVFALVQRSNARTDAREARARQLDATAVALLESDPELGLLLARESARLSPTATAEDVLRQALLASRVRTGVDAGRPLLAAAPVGARLVMAGDDGAVVVAGPGTARRTVQTGVDAVAASIARTAAVLLTGADGRLRLVTGAQTVLVPRVRNARGADLSPDGTLALVRGTGATVSLVDVVSGATVTALDHAGVTAGAISAGGRLLATGGSDDVVRIWRSDGRPLQVLRGHVGPITAIAFSARGTLIATASTDGVARIWRVGTGQPVTVLSGHGNQLTDVAFSPDGTQVATASTDRTARTWKAETGAALARLAGDTETVTSVRFDRTGTKLVTASLDGTARTWDAVVQQPLRAVADLGAPVTSLTFGAGGHAIDASTAARVFHIDLASRRVLPAGKAPAPPTSVSGPGGRRAVIDGDAVVVSGGGAGTVRLVGHRKEVTSVAFSDDGARLVTASVDHDVRTWDARTGAPLQVVRVHFAIVSDARFSPDGRWIATAGPVTSALVSADTGKLAFYLRGHAGKLTAVAFAPDGKHIATGGVDGTVRLYRCEICGGVHDLLSLADARLARTGRSLTDAERVRYLG